MDFTFRYAHDINLNCYTKPLYKHLETGNVLRQSMKVKNSPSSSLFLRHGHTWRIWQQFQEGLDYLNLFLIQISRRLTKKIQSANTAQLVTSFIALSGFLPKPALANSLEFVLTNHAVIENTGLLVSWLIHPQQKTICQGKKEHEPTLRFV